MRFLLFANVPNYLVQIGFPLGLKSLLIRRPGKSRVSNLYQDLTLNIRSLAATRGLGRCLAPLRGAKIFGPVTGGLRCAATSGYLLATLPGCSFRPGWLQLGLDLFIQDGWNLILTSG